MNLYSKLKTRLKGKVIVVGIGNEHMGDDAAGINLVKKLRNSDNLIPLLAFESPEFHLGEIIANSPDVVMFVDTADFNSSPGSVAIIERQQLRTKIGNTHKTPLSTIMSYTANLANSDTFLLGIQPETKSFNNSMSNITKKTINNLANVINTITTQNKAVYGRTLI
jgi:hydrogenase maturation protease